MVEVHPLIKKAVDFLQLDINYVFQATSFEDLTERVSELKKQAKKKFKELSKQYHPDVGGDEEKMKELLACMNVIKELKVEKPRPRFVYNFYPIYNHYYSTTDTTSATSAGWSGGGWASTV